jgi:hypothetical protein
MHLFRTVLLLLLAVFTLAGCSTGVHECDDSRDCASGKICVHEHAHDIDDDTCETPCTSASQCPAGYSCSCPDSPSGEACKTDDGAATFYCTLH